MSENLLATIKAGIKNSKQIFFPGTDKMIIVHVLSNQDILYAAIEADRLFKTEEVPVGFHNMQDFETEKDTQRLYRALRDPEYGKPLTPTITEFRQLITQGERAALIDEYNSLDQECNPHPDEMPIAEFDALVETLKKNPVQAIGKVSSISTLKKLAIFLAKQLWNSQTDSGSTST
jgi:hypothetical protein